MALQSSQVEQGSTTAGYALILRSNDFMVDIAFMTI